MKIVAIVRTRNETKNIERFCFSYQWADKVLVADGGSEDDTKYKASQFANVSVRDYTVRKQMNNGLWRNPEADHFNFLVNWALEEGADWIVQDDCDCYPNYLLKRDARKLIEESVTDFSYVTRMYLWREGKHFPRMAQPGRPGVWESSLWGWRASVGMKFFDTDMAYRFEPCPEQHQRDNFMPPYCLMHYTWTDEEIMRHKLKFYNDSGQIPGILHPMNYAGPLAPLEDWMKL